MEKWIGNAQLKKMDYPRYGHVRFCKLIKYDIENNMQCIVFTTQPQRFGDGLVKDC